MIIRSAYSTFICVATYLKKMANSTIKLLRPVLLFSEFLLIHPYLFSVLNKCATFFKYSITFLMIILYLMLLLIELPTIENNINNIVLDNLVTKFGALLLFFGAIILFSCIHLLNMFYETDIAKCIEVLKEIDSLLISLKKTVKFNNTMHTIRVFIGLGIVLFICVLQYFYIKPSNFIPLDGYKGILYFLAIVTIYCVECQYISLIQCVKERLQCLSLFMTDLNNCHEVLLVQYVRKQIILLDLVMDTYNRLCNVVISVNNCYSKQLILIIANKFNMLIYSTFYAYYFQTKSNRIFSTVWIITLCFSLYTLSLMSYVCHTTKSMSYTISVIVNKILIKNISEEVEEKLIIFSQQIFQRKITFNENELFDVDGSLLFLIMGSAVTYILVMLQFLNEPESHCSLEIVALNISQYNK